MISVPPKTHEGVMKRSEGSFSWITLSVYVIICVTPTSVRLWNATQEAGTRPVCIHELTHVIASTWSHGARWSGPICGLQHVAHRGAAHMQRTDTISRSAYLLYESWGSCLFIFGGVSSVSGLFIWRLKGGVQRGRSQWCGDGGILVQEGQQRL